VQNSGNSEFSNSKNVKYKLNFWQNFLLTLFGAAGLISMVVDGPRWITYPALIAVIALLLPVAHSSQKNKKT
jgi:DMSO/TMAO reductase YedYZ heme-binding membrane subunit